MMITAAIILILCIGVVESDMCKKLDKSIIESAYYFVIEPDCDTVYLSRKEIPQRTFEGKNSNKCEVKPIPFRWDAKSIAIVTKKDNHYTFHIVHAVALLDNQRNKSGIVTLKLHDVHQKFRWYIVLYQTLATCHRVTDVISCFTFDGQVVTQILLKLTSSRTVRIKRENTWTFEYNIDSLASYSTPEDETHLWIMHPVNWIYDINYSETLRKGEQKSKVYHVEGWQEPSYSSKAEIVFADENMFETRRCKRDGRCLYDIHVPRKITKLQSFCLYENRTSSFPTIFAHIKLPAPPTTTPPSEGKDHRESFESEEWMYSHYIPIQILAFITFVYLCFFFFYAFKPNPNSNLVELHAMMEEEYARLSLLTDEVVKRMIAERQRPPSLILKRQPGLAPVSTESTEMICCCGTTCESWLCPHCRTEKTLAGSRRRTFSLSPRRRISGELRFKPPEKWRTDSSRKRTKSVSRTSMPKKTPFNTYAKSTATSANPQDINTEKRPRPMSAAPIKRGYPWKGGSSEIRKLTPEKVMKRVSNEIRRATPERVRKLGSSQLRRLTPEKQKAQTSSIRAKRPVMMQMGGRI